MDHCRRVSALVGPYLDGALEPSATIEVEEHLSRCARCGERAEVELAMRASLKRAVATPCPAGLRERAKAIVGSATPRGNLETAGWKSVVPLAAAAAFALFWGASAKGPVAGALGTRAARATLAGTSNDVMRDFVAEHARPFLADRTDPKEVRQLDKYVGIPVRPVHFEQKQLARFLGARVVPMHQERTAMQQFEVGNGKDLRRVSILVFDPQKVQVEDGELTPRAVGTSEVRVGRSNGYSVAVTQRNGIGYAVASDLEPEQLVQYASFTEE